MSLMICENAGKCGNTKCTEKYPHENYGMCDLPCISVLKGAYPGSKCIPYIEPAMFNGAPDTLAKEQERRMAQVDRLVDGSLDNELLIKEITGAQEPIAPLTDHPKYCRLSKQPGGLCGWFDKNRCITPMNKFTNYIVDLATDWTICPRPEKQQPVELPKDPLEELIKEFCDDYRGYVCSNENGFNNFLKKFVDKVRAL